MSTVAVIGAGDLGGAIAQALAARDRVGRVLLIDAATNVAAGKALDIQQSGAVENFHCRVTATDDFTVVTGAAACIIADRIGPPSTEWQGDEALAMLGRVLRFLSDAPIIFAGASHSELMKRVWAELKVGPYGSDGPHKLQRERLIGTASEAYASAVRAIVALEARCSPSEVVLSVLGAPPEPRRDGTPGGGDGGGLIVPWSEGSIGGYALDRVLTQVQLTRIEARAARLWPPGPYTLGVAAARAAEAVVTSARRTFSVFTLLHGEFGVRNRIGALPVLLAGHGIAHIRTPSLNTREQVLVETALGR